MKLAVLQIKEHKPSHENCGCSRKIVVLPLIANNASHFSNMKILADDYK